MTTLRIGRLDVQIVTGSPTRVTLAGRIDDTARVTELLDQIPPGGVAVDAGGITFVNSVGMREWMRLVRALHWRGDVVRLEGVADMLMTQMNLIPEFKQAVTIASFRAQYVCPKCGNEATPLVDAVIYADQLKALEAPKLPCPECNAPMDLGDFPECYLSIFQP